MTAPVPEGLHFFVGRPALPSGRGFLRDAAEGADQGRQLGDRRRDALGIGAAHDQRGAEIAAPEIGVGADLEIGIAPLQGGQLGGDRPLAAAATGPSRIGSIAVVSSPRSALSQSVRPSISTGSPGSVRTSPLTRSRPTSTVGQPSGRCAR